MAASDASANSGCAMAVGICDDCLRKALRLKNIPGVQQATEALSKDPAYRRGTLFCAKCTDERRRSGRFGLADPQTRAVRLGADGH